MKSFDTEIAKYAQKIRLKTAERHELRERILAYMEYHPLPKAKRTLKEEIVSERFTFVHFNTMYTRIVTGAFAFLLIVGVPFAAERSVPGDVLYPVKTNINETVWSQFANSPYEKVAFETTLINRRIAEARLLDKEGKLTDAIEAEIAGVVKTHAAAAQQGITELKATDADEGAIAEISFGTVLDVQSAILAGGSRNASSTRSIAGVVRAAQENAAATKGSTTPSYERLMARVEQETTRAYELYESIKVAATEVEKTDIERRLADIERKIVAAQQAQDADATHGVSELAITLGDIQKLIAFMTDIDVRATVTLESLLPVVPTSEERTMEINSRLAVLEATWAIVSVRIEAISDEDLLDKIDVGVSVFALNMHTATTSLESGDFDSAEAALTSAEAMLADLDSLTAEVIIDEKTSVTPVDTATTTKATTTTQAGQPAEDRRSQS